MTIVSVTLTVLFLFLFLVLVFMVKNYLTYDIQIKWSEDKYSRKDWYTVKLPHYNHLLYNLKVWKYIPLDEYNEKYK